MSVQSKISTILISVKLHLAKIAIKLNDEKQTKGNTSDMDELHATVILIYNKLL